MTDPKPAPETDEPKDEEARQIRVYVPNPSAGPVHVDDGTPLIHPDTRSVNDSPLIQALIAAGRLRELVPVKKTRASKETT